MEIVRAGGASGNKMPLIPLDRLEDPRLLPYRQLKRSNLTRWSGIFVAEGEKVVLRLLASDLGIDSVLVAERLANRVLPHAERDFPIFVVPDRMIEPLVGFNFHRGLLACGRRPEPRTAAQAFHSQAESLLLVICPDVQGPENLGAILRSTSALGGSGVLLGPRACDPYSRRVLRVSMGLALHLPLVQSSDLHADLEWLRTHAKLRLCALVTNNDAMPLHHAPRRLPLGLMLGSEGHGLEPEWLRHCQERVTIPMRDGVDSLNVALAAGIALHHFSRL